jgi:hypothetical protein
VRELALSDWARTRIMDGHWVSPADIWYGHKVPGKPCVVGAVHPCPWSRPPEEASPATSSMSIEDDERHPQQQQQHAHPRPTTIKAPIPPTFRLCQQAFLAHQAQLRTVLIPAMRNLVRKLVIECSTPGLLGKGVEDPAIRAARMSIEDVVRELREEDGVWFDGIDWVERGMNVRRERERQRPPPPAVVSDGSSGSGSERSSERSSPVLSTSTLQTTPSPPPHDKESDVDVEVEIEDVDVEVVSPVEPVPTSPVVEVKRVEVVQKVVTIPVGPVLDPPRLLPSIPYVPLTTAGFPVYTVDALKNVRVFFFLSYFWVLD